VRALQQHGAGLQGELAEDFIAMPLRRAMVEDGSWPVKKSRLCGHRHRLPSSLVASRVLAPPVMHTRAHSFRSASRAPSMSNTEQSARWLCFVQYAFSLQRSCTKWIFWGLASRRLMGD